jgi:hypothetical protein
MQIPAAWENALRLIQTYAPSAVLAGGALRDLDNGKPVKDLDIFVHGYHEIDTLRLTMRLKQTFDAQYLEGTKDVLAAYKVLNDLECPEINIVHLRAPFTSFQCIERMDFGICQIAYLSNGMVETTAAYDADRRNHTITLMRADDQPGFDWSMRRYERLSKKYPWPLVVPQHFKDLYGPSEFEIVEGP